MGCLLLDAGNTRLKWAITDDAGQIAERGAVAHPIPDRLVDVWRQGRIKPTRAIFSSVAGEKVDRQIVAALVAAVGDAWTRFTSTPVVAGMLNDYSEPASLGSDRLAAALGAWQRVRQDCLVVNCGTATTIDVVRAIDPLQENSTNATGRFEARFCGGAILPGLAMMKSALGQGTAKLPTAAGNVVGVPRNTHDAIETGCRLAQVGAVELMTRDFTTPPPIVLSGGASPAMRGLLENARHRLVDAPDLVLEGLSVAILHGSSR